jgi:hypothetical protein
MNGKCRQRGPFKIEAKMMTFTNASSAAGLSKRLRVLSLFGGATLMLAATVPSQASITPSDVDAWQHIVDCAGALFSNPAEHAQFCLPGHAEAINFQANFMSKDLPPAIIPPPPPPDCVECEVVLLDVGGE